MAKRKLSKKVITVKGWYLPPPRLTLAGVWLAVCYIGLPFLLAMLLLDVVGYLISDRLLGQCYGLLCLL